MVTSIAVYNYKGGVAKTTLARELGATLAKCGRKVVLVDADPQCNLTAFLRLGVYDERDDAGAGANAAPALVCVALLLASFSWPAISSEPSYFPLLSTTLTIY